MNHIVIRFVPMLDPKSLSLVAAFLTILCGFSAHGDSGFTGLGFLSNDPVSSLAVSISDDGTAITGNETSETRTEAFRWTAEGGMVGLGDLPGGTFLGGFFSRGSDINGNGSVVVGHGVPSDADPWEAFRWTQNEGMVGLGVLDWANNSTASGVSSDGSVVTGRNAAEGWREAFRWTAEEGMVSLGSLSTEGFGSDSRGISGDGSTIVGQSGSAIHPGERISYRWTSEEGMVELGDLAGGNYTSVPYGVSNDGTVVVGRGNSDNGGEAYRWSPEDGMVGLGDLPGGSADSTAYGVSPDGSVIVGFGHSENGREAFIWDLNHGMQSLTTLLLDQGVNLDGWDLTHALDVIEQGEGHYLVTGYGLHNDLLEGFVAQLHIETINVSGDLDGDGYVGITDLDLVLADWGNFSSPADADGDGTVGQADLDIVIANWASGTPPAVIPEPGSLVYFGIVSVALIRHRRKPRTPRHEPSTV